MTKQEQLQLKQATDDIKRLEKILVVLSNRIVLLAKEDAKIRATAHRLQKTIINLETKLHNQIG